MTRELVRFVRIIQFGLLRVLCIIPAKAIGTEQVDVAVGCGTIP